MQKPKEWNRSGSVLVQMHYDDPRYQATYFLYILQPARVLGGRGRGAIVGEVRGVKGRKYEGMG